MTIEEKKLLADISLSISSIDDHLEGRRILTEYVSNKTKRRAVERELEIIGEAINRLLKINPLVTPPKFGLIFRRLIYCLSTV
jgi:uncharacterized protein with HEPN domain